MIVPWTELRVWPEVEEGAIEFAPHPGRGHWVNIEIVFVAPGTTTALVFDEMYALGSLRLVDGGEVKVIARRHRPAPEEAAKVAVQREQAIARALQSSEVIASLKDPKGNPRAAVGVRLPGRRHTRLDRTRAQAGLAHRRHAGPGA